METSFAVQGLGWFADNLPFITVFVTTVLAVFGASIVFESKTAVRHRLRGANGETSAMATPSVRYRQHGAFHRLVVEPLRDKLVPDDASEATAARLRLIQAGFPSPQAVAAFYVTRVMLALALPIALVLLSPFVVRPLATNELLLLASVAGLIGYLAPAFYLSKCLKRRQRVLREALPDALDLLLVCTEAGLSLDSAIARVGDEIGKPYPLLGEQFQIMSAELRAGKSRDDGLRGLAARTGVDEISALATVLIQSGALGTSIGAALRVYSDDMRTRRMTAAEEKAQKLSVKLAMMLIILILPPLMITVMLPTIVHAMRMFARNPIVH
jgi:tight adherence protein C